MNATKNTRDKNPAHEMLESLRTNVQPRLARLMGYFRNPATDLADFLPTRGTTLGVRPYRQYQEIGLPARITGFRNRDGHLAVLAGPPDYHRREVVIENDIGWRLHTLVDFAAGQMPAINSTAKDPQTRSRLTTAIRDLLDNSGGVGMLQQLLLAGAVHGSAYLKIEPNGALLEKLAGGAPQDNPALRFVALSAARVLPSFAPGAAEVSGAQLRQCAILDESAADFALPKNSWLARVGDWVRAAVGKNDDKPADACELWEPSRFRRFVGDSATNDSGNILGFVPVVGYINQADPAGGLVPGLGVSDVEPLIPMQDELNTRLSDRANRVTLQSFRMYLGKGIEDFAKRPVGPGQMWSTDNPDAEITAFGGDAAAPSEDAHINEIREALDKISGVTPVAAGLLRGKVGNLTSAVAIRITLIALLARTERKRGSLALTLAAAFRRALEILDRAGLVKSEPEDRGVEITWPSAIPENTGERLAEAQLKLSLGVPRGIVLAELGYDDVEVREGQKGDAHESGSNIQPSPKSGGGAPGATDAGETGDGAVPEAAPDEVIATD